MTGPRRTLTRMDLELLLTDVLDVIVEQDGDWDATEAVLRERYAANEDDLRMALDTYAATLLWVYEEPGDRDEGIPPGYVYLRTMRDRRRRLQPEPARPRKRRWRVA